MQRLLQKKLLLGTNNPGKVKEMREILNPLKSVQLITPGELNLILEVEETGSSYQENAALKAIAFSEATRLPCLADDSGLEVDALNGAPGIYSARFSPKPNASAADHRTFLLEELSNYPQPWTARFRAVIAIALPGETTFFAEGICEGEIINEDRGINGFGYDPIFYLPEKGVTMAEIEEKIKNQISHRGKGIQKALPILKEILNI